MQATGMVATHASEPSADPPVDLDRATLERVAAGEVEAYGELVRRHQDRLLSLCERFLGDREEARDAAQEVLLKVYRKAGSFQPRGRVSTWLHRIAVNHCLNRLRRRKLARFFSFSDLGAREEEDGETTFDPPDPAAGPEEQLATRRRWQQTRRAIDRLPQSQRSVLILSRFEGMSQREMAEVLGISEGAVESRLVRAMRTLRLAQETRASSVTPGRRSTQ